MVLQPLIAWIPIRAFKKQFLSMPGSSCTSQLFTANERSVILLFAPLAFFTWHFVRLELWAKSRTRTSVSSEWMTHVPTACRTWRTIRLSASSRLHWSFSTGSHAAASKLNHWSSVVTYMMRLPSLPLNVSVFHCDTRNLTIPGLFAMKLSSSVPLRPTLGP